MNSRQKALRAGLEHWGCRACHLGGAANCRETCRMDKDLDEIIAFLTEQGLVFKVEGELRWQGKAAMTEPLTPGTGGEPC